MSDYVSLDVRTLDPSAFPRFRVIVADPPWWYNDQRKERKDGSGPTRGIGACHHYDQMETPEICELKVGDLADERCHLYLWATAPLMMDAFQVMDAWGFKFSTYAHVWAKMNTKAWMDRALWERAMVEASGWVDRRFSVVCSVLDALTVKGPGFFTMSNAEFLLLGVRKKPGTKTTTRPFRHAQGRKVRQLIHWPRIEPHSRKPEIFQNAIQYMYPRVTPRVEVFARRARSGWTTIGNQELFSPYEYRDPDKTELEE